MPSLKVQLYEFIRQKGYISYTEMETFAHEHGYRVENAARRLRELCEKKDKIKNVTYEDGKAIKGYTWIVPIEIYKPTERKVSKLFALL